MTTLTPQQHRVISAIANGSTITQAAAAEKIHRNTIGNWRRTNPDFAQELELATQEYRQFWNEQITSLIPQAIKAVEDCLTDPKSSPSLRLRAATFIIKMASQPKLGSFIPIVQKEAEIAEPAQTCTTPTEPGHQAGHLASFIPDVQTAQQCTTEPELASFIPTPETTDSTENPDLEPKPFLLRDAAKAWAAAQNAQKPQPVRVAPQPGRNEPCPCNSGQKFKRCCLNKAKAA